MFRIIKECRPAWVIGENVAGFITMALDDVLSNLESEGYTCQTFVIPACAVNGIHRRGRVWIVAHSNSNSEPSKPVRGSEGKRFSANSSKLRCNDRSDNREERHLQNNKKRQPKKIQRQRNEREFRSSETRSIASNADSDRLQRGARQRKPEKKEGGKLERGKIAGTNSKAGFRSIQLPTEPEFRMSNDEFPRQLVGGVKNANAEEERSIEVLRHLWVSIYKKKIQWEAGGYDKIYFSEILQRELHGEKFPIRRSKQESFIDPCEKIFEIRMRALQGYQKAIYSPQGQKLEKQQSLKLTDALQFVSHHLASQAGGYCEESPVDAVFCLRETILQKGSLLHSLNKIKKKWESIANKEKNRIAVRASFGFRPIIEIPTEPTVRHKDDGLPENVARLKALGNAVVPQIPELIGRAIMEAENEKQH